MPDEKQTPEPWKFDAGKGDSDCFGIFGPDFDSGPVAYLSVDPSLDMGMRGSLTDAANARRIVACVNACKGLSTEALEAAGLGGVSGAVMGRLEMASWVRDEYFRQAEDENTAIKASREAQAANG